MRELYAATVDEAVEKAAGELGLSVEEVSYRVLDEGNTGFLGIGARDARIIVEAPESKVHEVIEEDAPPATASESTEVVDHPEPEPFEAARNPGPPVISEVYGESSESDHAEAPEELLVEVRELVS